MATECYEVNFDWHLLKYWFANTVLSLYTTQAYTLEVGVSSSNNGEEPHILEAEGGKRGGGGIGLVNSGHGLDVSLPSSPLVLDSGRLAWHNL